MYVTFPVLIHQWTFRLLLHLGCCEWCCSEHGCARSPLWDLAFSSFRCVLRSGITVLYSSCTFNSLSSHHTVSHSTCIILRLPRIVYGCSNFSASLPALIFRFLYFIYSGLYLKSVFLVCISLIISDVEPVFISLLAIYYFRKYLFLFLALLGLVALCGLSLVVVGRLLVVVVPLVGEHRL